MRTRKSVRPPAVAGHFYTGDRERLNAQVQSFIASAANYVGPPPKAIIAPHAGYMYSGAIAGRAFAAVRAAARPIARVVLIGPAHYVPFQGIAVPTVDAFETPLGRISLDPAALAALGDLPFVCADDTPHALEHALEVELPFLQSLLRDFLIVPLVVGDAESEQVGCVLSRLWGNDGTLIVVSSDLSHYHEYEAARRIDAATAAHVEQAQWAMLGPQNACGYLPIAGLLREVTQRGLKARRLALCNSGDTAGDRARVVGYGAWAFG